MHYHEMTNGGSRTKPEVSGRRYPPFGFLLSFVIPRRGHDRRITCPECDVTLKLARACAGKKVKCPSAEPCSCRRRGGRGGGQSRPPGQTAARRRQGPSPSRRRRPSSRRRRTTTATAMALHLRGAGRPRGGGGRRGQAGDRIRSGRDGEGPRPCQVRQQASGPADDVRCSRLHRLDDRARHRHHRRLPARAERPGKDERGNRIQGQPINAGVAAV
jgi:hypothetical protein